MMPASGYDGDDASMPDTRAAAVAAKIRRMILSGELAPGSRLRQAEIGRRFGVSTTPVREAFASLAMEGLVSQDVHRGVEVVVPRVEDIRENYEIRLALEPLATALAAGRLNDAQIDELEQITERMRTSEDRTERARLNHAFHSLIYGAADRPRLADMIEHMRNSARMSQSLFAAHPVAAEYRALSYDEHREIAAALRVGDGEQAAAAMARHLEHNYEHIVEALTVMRETADAAFETLQVQVQVRFKPTA